MKRFYLLLFAAVLGVLPAPGFASTLTFTINAGSTVTAIPAQTYGSDQTLAGVINPLYRQGGNRMTAYNWENNASNAGTDYGPNHEDWYDVPAGVTPPGMPATTLTDFILGNNALGVDSLVTLQMAGYVSTNGSCNCNVTVTGAADTAGTYWKAVVFNGGPTTGSPNTSDNVVYMNEEMAYLLSQVGGAGSGGAKFYDLDNEPALWNSTHPMVHPSQPSCAEVSGKGITLAQVITTADPNAQILGPVAYGWSEYVNNQSASDSPTGLSPSYGVTYLCYYLQQFNNASTTAGRRLLHYLDLHWYPEATGPETISGSVTQIRILNNDTTYGVDVARMQAPRSLWDPTYTESSWITWGTGGPITLIPRL
ncbi:MAG TPA: glycoside hydrolase family 44 protein, partial [bacterium]|nr:glycoside hydrolase family 44 protein [bacterium]